MNSTEQIIRYHEGKEDQVYQCSAGVLTLGIGHALHVGSFVPDEATRAFFEYDMGTAYLLYEELDLELDAVRKAAVVNMCFNLGPQIKGWKFIKEMRKHNWLAAADQLKSSRWWGQVGRRSEDIWQMVMTGQWPRI